MIRDSVNEVSAHRDACGVVIQRWPRAPTLSVHDANERDFQSFLRGHCRSDGFQRIPGR